MIRQDILKNIKRVVIKIGSSVISNKDKGQSSLECGLSKDWVRHYARQIKLIQDKGMMLCWYLLVLLWQAAKGWV